MIRMTGPLGTVLRLLPVSSLCRYAADCNLCKSPPRRVYERMSLSRDICHVDADLAVVNFAKPAAPLPRDAHRLGPSLGECRRIENDHGIGRAQVFADLTGQSLEQRLVVPRHMPDELLQALAFLVMKVGDRLAGLAFELGEETGHVLGGVPSLFR